jgi:hypothetical protein
MSEGAKSAVKFGAAFGISTGIRTAVHEVVPPDQSPFAKGVFPTLLQTGTTLLVGHGATNPSVANFFGVSTTPMPWQYRSGVWAMGRSVGGYVGDWAQQQNVELQNVFKW